MISVAYELGDSLAIEVMYETGRILGFGLSNEINLLNPEVIIVGGGISAAGDRLLNSVRDTVGNHALKLSSKACKIVQAKLGGQAGMIGAVALRTVRFWTYSILMNVKSLQYGNEVIWEGIPWEKK